MAERTAIDSLGTFHHTDEPRDAIHIAVIQVEAGEKLKPGEAILIDGGIAFGTMHGKGNGIVDPFLPDLAPKGTLFWCLLYPRTIESLRHVWTHPDLPDEPAAGVARLGSKADSEAWLRRWCDDHGDAPPYEDLIETAARNDDPEYLHFGMDASGEIPTEVWLHIENVVGLPLTRAKWFSCTC